MKFSTFNTNDILSSKIHFQWTNIGLLFIFISQQISSQNLPEDLILLTKVVNYLKMEEIENETVRQHSEREQAWLDLLGADRINHIGIGELLLLARKSKCYRVVQHLLEKRKAYDEILDCYLPDPRRHIEMWSYLRQYANKSERKIYEQCHENFTKLLLIDSDETTKLVVDHFCDRIGQLIRLLEHDNDSLYRLIQNLLKQHVSLDTNDCEHYLNLLCQYNPENVEQFLRNNKNYRLENALEIVKKYELYQSLIYLYEKQGDFESAFSLSLELLKESAESTVEMRALELSALCNRASEALSEVEREKLWFTFIRVILSRTDLTTITRTILHAASSYVNLTNLVQLVLSSGTKTGNFGDIKHLLVGMLANSKYETFLLQTTSRVLGYDLHCMLAKQKIVSSRGLSVKSIKCIICRSRLYNQHDALVFGSCGHATHKACVGQIEDNDKLQCPRCGLATKDQINISNPRGSIYPIGTYDTNMDNALQLEAPKRSTLPDRIQ